MLIIFEGADGTGKSTLIKKITNELACDVTCDIRYEVGAYIRYMNMCMSDETYLCDRSFISDLVYRLSDDEKPDYMMLDDMIRILKENTKIIYCDSDTCYEDSIERGETNITKKNRAITIRKTYKLIMTMLDKFTNVPIYYYDWHYNTLEDVIKFINKEV